MLHNEGVLAFGIEKILTDVQPHSKRNLAIPIFQKNKRSISGPTVPGWNKDSNLDISDFKSLKIKQFFVLFVKEEKIIFWRVLAYTKFPYLYIWVTL